MARIVIASPSETIRAQLFRLLASSGHSAFRHCSSEGELRRALSECDDGIVLICAMNPDDIAADFGNCFQFLVIGRPEFLSTCESTQVFKLAYPCAGSAVMGAIEMLSQLHHMRLPKRSGTDRATVEEAKQLLMRVYGIDEPEAHRRMQQYAMRHNMKMVDYAIEILNDRNS